MRTYLLERSRLTFQPDSERNYHIFYQICAAVPAAEKKELGIESWDKFFYLSQGNTGTVNGMDDVEEFSITQKGMSTVGISVSTQWDIFKICAALLHIGNIKITDSRGVAAIDENDAALGTASRLLGVNPVEFKKWLIKKQITTRSEKIVSDANCAQAIVSRDSIAKFIYSMLFDWIVKIVNLKLDTASASKEQRFIGVLDIYGFEHFVKNSFEQFCINYANEKLQAEFARHVFKLEQEEYVAEEISWSFIDFSDNQPCIDMIENKLGVLDLLDEESRLPSGADSSLITKLYQRFGTAEHKFFSKPRFGEKEFVIKHYALDVSYQIEGFIEKNKDTVSEEQLIMLNNSSFDFFKEVIFIDAPPETDSPQPGRKAGGNKKPTLGSIFKGSLIKLMETLRQTNPHYIRCIKPNQSKVAFEFEPQNVLAQLVACGVLETIKISRAGYPSKQTYNEFINRYYFLVPSSEWKEEPKTVTLRIVQSTIKGENKYELGKTKIFFRAGQLAYLEKVRSEKFTAIVILIQKNALRNYHQRMYQKKKVSAVKIQTAWRAHAARKMYKSMREEAAAIKIQTSWRMNIARKKCKKTLAAISTIQRAWRHYVGRRDFEYVQRQKAASKIKATWKMYRQRKAYKKDLHDIVVAQSCWRRRVARKQYKLLKTEARSVGGIKQKNTALEKKVFELSLLLDSKKREASDLAKQVSNLEENVNSWKDKYVRLESETKAKSLSVLEEVSELKKNLQVANEAKETFGKDADKLQVLLKKRDDQVTSLQKDLEASKAEVAKTKEALKNAPKEDDSKTVANLRKEVANLREQMNKLVAGKYKTDRVTERILNNDSTREVPQQPGPVSSTANRVSNFFESAAQVTNRLAGSLSGSNLSLEKRVPEPIEIEGDTEPKEVIYCFNISEELECWKLGIWKMKLLTL